MTPYNRRTSDKFDPKPLPENETERLQQQWYMLQLTVFQVSRLNGNVQKNTDDIGRVDKDVTVAKRLGWIALLIAGTAGSLAGLYAAFIH